MGLDQSGIKDDVRDEAFISLRFSVGNTEIEAKVGGAPLARRQELIIYNDSNKTIYVGPTGVTTNGATKGIPVEPTETANFPLGENISVFMIAQSGSNNVIVQEFA